MDNVWTEERIETLRRCAGEGKSFSECAYELGPCFTRNMVAGKADRLGVKFHGASKCINSFTRETAAAAGRLAWKKPGRREAHSEAMRQRWREKRGE